MSVLDDLKAADVAQRCALADEAKALLDPKASVSAFADRLLEQAQPGEAMRILAHALPKREAVWWLVRCAEQSPAGAPGEAGRKALAAARDWVKDPSEPRRRACMPTPDAADMSHAAGCAAVAAFWSGGSLAPEGAPVVPPPEHLTGHAVWGGVMLAAVQQEPEKAPERLRAFAGLARAVAAGQDHWTKPGAA